MAAKFEYRHLICDVVIAVAMTYNVRNHIIIRRLQTLVSSIVVFLPGVVAAVVVLM